MEHCVVVEPMFRYNEGLIDQNGKKAPPRYYMVLSAGEERRRCKIPFRYNRVMCKVTGDKTLQELVKGDEVEASMEFTEGVWKILKVIT